MRAFGENGVIYFSGNLSGNPDPVFQLLSHVNPETEMRTPLISLTFLMFAFAATAGASSITFFDGAFAPGAWSSSVAASLNIASSNFSFDQVTTGGDPTSYESETHSFTAGAGTNTGMRFQNFDSNYSFGGSFDSLNYSYNLLDPGGLNVGYSIAILQGGLLYSSTPLDVVTSANTSVWSSAFSQTGLTSASFCEVISSSLTLDCATHPVFTGNSTPTIFGYLVSNSFLNSGSRQYSSGIDNWSVTLVNAAPEPSSMAFYCAGGLLFAVLRLRCSRLQKPLEP
jgi:hypothetical protein